MLTKLNHYLVMTPKFTFLKTIVKEFQIGTLGMNLLVQSFFKIYFQISTTMTENSSKKIWESTLSKNAKESEWNPVLR